MADFWPVQANPFEGWNDIVIVGDPYRGLIIPPVAGVGKIELDGSSPSGDDTLIEYPGSGVRMGDTQLVKKSPAPPIPFRTIDEVADDLAKGYTWTNYVILSSENKNMYGRSLGANNSIYIDPAGNRWLFNWTLETADYPTQTTFNLTATLTSRFGVYTTYGDDITPAAPVNIEKLNQDFDRNAVGEDPFVLPAIQGNDVLTIEPHEIHPVQQNPTGSKVMLLWVAANGSGTLEQADPPHPKYGCGPQKVSVDCQKVWYIVEASISGTGLDDDGTGIVVTASLIKDFEVEYSGNTPATTNDRTEGYDGTVVVNTMVLKTLDTTDGLTCVGGLDILCGPLCPSGQSITGSHDVDQATVTIGAPACEGVNTWYDGEFEYEKSWKCITTAYYDRDGVAHFLSFESRQWQEMEYEFSYTSTFSEDASKTVTLTSCAPPTLPLIQTGSYTMSGSASGACLERVSYKHSTELFIDGLSVDFAEVERTSEKTEVVSWSQSDSEGPGDLGFDNFGFDSCAACGGTNSDVWYLPLGIGFGANFVRSGTNTLTTHTVTKYDGNVVDETGPTITVRVIDGVDDGELLFPCGNGANHCFTNGCGPATVSADHWPCFGFADCGAGGCAPEVGGIAGACEVGAPPVPCQSLLPRGLDFFDPGQNDTQQMQMVLHSNKSFGYRIFFGTSGASQVFTRSYKAVTLGEPVDTTIFEGVIFSSVHPVDDRFEIRTGLGFHGNLFLRGIAWA